jgi:hypothetical protein
MINVIPWPADAAFVILMAQDPRNGSRPTHQSVSKGIGGMLISIRTSNRRSDHDSAQFRPAWWYNENIISLVLAVRQHGSWCKELHLCCQEQLHNRKWCKSTSKQNLSFLALASIFRPLYMLLPLIMGFMLCFILARPLFQPGNVQVLTRLLPLLQIQIVPCLQLLKWKEPARYPIIQHRFKIQHE